MRRRRLLAAAGATLLVALTAVGIAVAAEAQSGGEVKEGSAPYAVARALTEEEAAAGVPVQAQYFNSFEEALRSIGADPGDVDASSPACTNAVATAGVDEAVDAVSPAGPEKHCVVRIEPVKPGETVSKMSETTCFGSFSEAIGAATGGAVRLASNVRPADVTEEMLKSTSGGTVISIDYKNPNFSGSTLVWSTSISSGCYGYSYYAPTMPSGWNDVVSSARTFASCNYNPHYENTYYGGALLYCECATMGIMNDRTSSERWWR